MTPKRMPWKAIGCWRSQFFIDVAFRQQLQVDGLGQ